MLPNYKLRFNGRIKILLLVCLLLILVNVTRLIDIQQILQSTIIGFNNQVNISPIAFIFIYNLGTLLFIPGSLLTLKGGYLFGLFWGSIYVLIAALLGAILSFLIGRYLSRNWVYKQLEKHPKFKLIDHAVGKEGWKIVLLTRLSPVFPFNLLNYGFGVTQVSVKDYILGSLGILPGTIMYVYMGSLAVNITMITTSSQLISSEVQIWQFIMQLIGLIATIFTTVYITKISQKALSKKVEDYEY
ncbi:TVP38/TMEM64 family protein [Cuspidothrix issatschenkoi LEGE 03284]|uniref:TVP38/TMEM64 family protein n=1 Tax=Cuspidothrix issatschenkoi TaxID=230752 RepID=UPI00188214A4|nr:TVP38/TMEM64 family protein [Cuspidothrix issatschenkoi]MBE9230912.1 TVP38/TMEM64 family protein [Cuspidothrix issatschenkoi LEGE 03284]